MNRFILALFLTISVVIPSRAATGLSSALFTNLNLKSFVVDLNVIPTNAVKVNLHGPGSPDGPGDIYNFINGTTWSNLMSTNLYVTNAYITNLFVNTELINNLYVTNLYATNITAENFFVTNLYVLTTNFYFTNIVVSNLFATTEYVTNLYVTNLTVRGRVTIDNSVVINTNTFITNINSTVVNEFTTNIFDNSVVINTNTFITNINSVVVNTNTFITNVNSVIVNTNTFITNVNTTVINTNVTQQFISSTNFIDNSTTFITNSFITITNTVININGNTNIDAAFLWTNNAGILMPVDPLLPVVITNTLTANEGFFYGTNAVSIEAAGPISLEGLTNRIGDNNTTITYNGVPIVGGFINPTDSYLPYRTSATTFGNSPLQVLGSTLYGAPTTSIGNDSGLKLRPVLENNGFSGIDVIAGGDGVHTNHSATYGLYAESAVPSYSNSSEAYGLWGDGNAPGATFNMGVIGNARAGTNRFGVVGETAGGSSLGIGVLSAKGSSSNSTNVLFYADTGRYFNSRPAQDAMYMADNRATGYPLFVGLSNGTQDFVIGSAGELIFGTGTTNVLFRSGDSLVYTNGDTANNVFFRIGAGSGPKYAEFGADNSGGVHITSTVANQPVYINAGGAAGGLFVGPNSLQPQSEVMAIGTSSSNGAWTNAYLKGKLYLQGMNDGAGNYSRLAIGLSDTNSPIVFDSQSGGIAGSPRPFAFTNSPVEHAKGLSTRRLPPAYFDDFSALPDAYLSNIVSGPMAAGTSDLFTPPSGYKAVIVSATKTTTNATATASYAMVKTNSVYYRIANSSNISTNTPQGTSPAFYTFNDTETYAVTNGNAGLNMVSSFLVMPSAEKLVSPKMCPLPAGQSTLYTVPASTYSTALRALGSSGIPNVAYSNSSGAARLVTIYYIPSGSSVTANSYQIRQSIADATTATGWTMPFALLAGDSIVINTDGSGAGECAWITLVEVPTN